MKKIVVMSDSHGYHQMINRVKELEPDGDYYVHCGDSEAETYMMQDWLCVKGNNDWYSDFPNQIKFKVEDLNFLVTHGHRFGYMDRETSMIYTLQEANCDVLLSGHTHVPMYKEVDGCTLINPGSTTLPRGGSNRSYCVIYVEGKDLKVEFKNLDDFKKEIDYAKRLLDYCRMNGLIICGDYICEVLSELSIFDHHERSMFLRLQVPVSFKK